MSHPRKDRPPPPPPDVLTHLEAVEDPRLAAQIPDRLDAVLLLVLCAVISGAAGGTALARAGDKQRPCRRRVLPFQPGPPRSVGPPVVPSGAGSVPTRRHRLARRLACQACGGRRRRREPPAPVRRPRVHQGRPS